MKTSREVLENFLKKHRKTNGSSIFSESYVHEEEIIAPSEHRNINIKAANKILNNLLIIRESVQEIELD